MFGLVVRFVFPAPSFRGFGGGRVGIIVFHPPGLQSQNNVALTPASSPGVGAMAWAWARNAIEAGRGAL